MPKATFILPNGTSVTIEGTPEEVRDLLAYYSGTTSKTTSPSQKHHSLNADKDTSAEKKIKPDKADIEKIIHLAKTCKEADAVGKYILDKTNEANRVLLPLYIVHEHLDNAYGLTTSEISEVTIGLGAKVSRQNALRAVKLSAPDYVLKLGKPPRYKIHRRGLAHIKSIIQGEESTEPNQKKPVKKVSKKRKAAKGGKGPQTQMLELKDSGFFSEKRSISDIQKKLEELGHIYAQSSLSGPLIRLVRGKKLNRVKENDSWYYISP